MRHKLVVVAHPSKNSLSHKIMNYFSLKGENILDLYSKKDMQDYLYFDDVLNQNNDEKRKIMQKKITQADEIILVFPIWWWSFPAVMKNFLDVNLSFWFAFKYSEQDQIYPGLTWKKISIFCTCNSPEDRYNDAFKKYIKLHFEECCWMTLNNFYIFGDMRFMDKDREQKILELIHKQYG